MDKLWLIIKQTDGRILVLAVITFFAVAFSFYQMAGAFSGEEETPEYRRSPASAFALPVPDTIVDAQKLTLPRLPDKAYVTVINKTQKTSQKIADQTVNQAFLRKQGMTASQAKTAYTTLESYFNIYTGRETSLDNQVTLGNITSSSAETSQSIVYGPGAGNSPAGLFEVTYAFSLSNGNWNLDTISINF